MQSEYESAHLHRKRSAIAAGLFLWRRGRFLNLSMDRLPPSVIPGLTGNLLAADETRARGKGHWRALGRGLARVGALLERP